MSAVYFYLKDAQAPKVILIGLDGADWDIIDHFIAKGKLANFKRFKEEGAWSRLKSFSPMLSPSLWSTIATGKSPAEHGIVDFLVWDEVQKTRIPVGSNLLRSKPVWDILGQKGFKVGVFNWLVSWPAQKVNGVLVSDRVGYHIFPHIVGDRLKVEGLSWPSDYVFKRKHLLMSPAEVMFEDAMPFVHITRGEFEKSFVKGKYDIKNPQYNLRMILSTTKTVSRLALENLETKQPDFLALYFDSPDTMMHTYMDYAPPKLSRVSQKDYEKYKDAIEETYVMLDRILGDFLKEAAPDTEFILVSDHGFKWGSERLNTPAAIGDNAEEIWHDSEGIVAFLGPSFQRGKELKGYDLYDITPTLLYLYGLPLAEDMKGQIMSAAFKEEAFHIEKIKHVATYETARQKEAIQVTASSSTDASIKERLVSLGYINQGELVSAAKTKTKEGAPKSRFDTRNPLLEAHHLEESGKEEEALQLYEKILDENPNTKKASVIHNQLALLYQKKGMVQKALRHIQKAIYLKPELSSFYVNQGNILRENSLFHKAESAYQKALSLNAKDSMAHYNLGFLYEKQKMWKEAKEKYQRALNVDPKFQLAKTQFLALLRAHGTQKEVDRYQSSLFKEAGKKGDATSLLQEASFLISKKENAKALEILKKASKIEPNNSLIYNDIGGLYLATRKPKEALSYFKKALLLDPAYELAYLNLGSTYLELKKWGESKKYFQDALNLNPKNATVYYLLGKVEMNLYQKEEAKKNFQKALKLQPGFLAAQEMLKQLTP